MSYPPREIDTNSGRIPFARYGSGFRQRRARPGETAAELERGITSTGDECMVWPFSISLAHGYGLVTFAGKARYVHRVVCEAVHGPAPLHKPMALHSCGNRPCFNGRHLRWGDQTENMADMVRHGRHRW